jgi:folate-binding protein YgfZ
MTGEHAATRVLLEVSGADRVHFLQGLVTNDVGKLEQGLVYAALLSPQGKFLVDFLMVPLPEAIGLDVAADQAAGLAQRLGLYKLRADVQITQSALHVQRGLGDAPAGAYRDPRHAALGWRAYEVAQGTPPTIDWAAIRVANMNPETGIELVPNESFILEMGFEALGGVDFRKGCYVGQEVTARMKHKTELRKGLAQVTVTGDAQAGDAIMADGKAAGTLLTRSGDTALAYLRFDRAKGAMLAQEAIVTRQG